MGADISVELNFPTIEQSLWDTKVDLPTLKPSKVPIHRLAPKVLSQKLYFIFYYISPRPTFRTFFLLTPSFLEVEDIPIPFIASI